MRLVAGTWTSRNKKKKRESKRRKGMNKDPLRMQLTKIEVCQSFKQISTVVCCTLDRKGKNRQICCTSRYNSFWHKCIEPVERKKIGIIERNVSYKTNYKYFKIHFAQLQYKCILLRYYKLIFNLHLLISLCKERNSYSKFCIFNLKPMSCFL